MEASQKRDLEQSRLLAGLFAMPRDPLEAAKVDGCNPWQVFRHITLPFLMPFAYIAMAIRSLDVARAYDLVADGSDNFATRLAVNRAAVALQAPLLSAAIGAFEGQVALYQGWRADSPCYACLVGDDPDRPGINCAETGVMGALAGMIGTMAALEAVRALTGWGAPLTGRLAIIDMLDRRWREVGIAKDPGCPTCRG